jgi:hypothetical protein
MRLTRRFEGTETTDGIANTEAMLGELANCLKA